MFSYKIEVLLTSRIIWPTSLSLVILTDFSLEQQTVPNVLSPKDAKMGELLKRPDALLRGGPGQTSFAFALVTAMSVYSAHFSPVIISNVLIFSVFYGKISLISLCFTPNVASTA